jgi:hypothetical protein
MPGIMSSASSNNEKEDAWLMKMELKAEGPKENRYFCSLCF